MNSLNGIKILIRGNHDCYDIGHKRKNIKPIENFYTDAGFIAVVEAITERNMILLSHAPMKLSRDITMNIHGHFHNSNHRNWEAWYQEMYSSDNRYRILAIEYEGYKPVLLDEFVARG